MRVYGEEDFSDNFADWEFAGALGFTEEGDRGKNKEIFFIN